MKDQGAIVVLAAVAAGCILYGMLRENDPVFIIGLALGVPAYLLFRKRYREQIREKYGESRTPPAGENTPKENSAGTIQE